MPSEMCVYDEAYNIYDAFGIGWCEKCNCNPDCPMKKMPNELKPCPFCGGEAKINIRKQCYGHGEYHNEYFVKCKLCGASSGFEVVYYLSPKECEEAVTKRWNRRAGNEI